MNKTKIDWCDVTVNPVVGCPRGCEYCYARKINNRFHIVPDFNKPQFFPERLKQFESKKPKSIFVDSMSDVEFWKPEWENAVIQAMSENPQHSYIFLTKAIPGNHPRIYLSGSCFYGVTITCQKDAEKMCQLWDFLSIEPLLEELTLDLTAHNNLKQIIIGAETGNRKGKVVPKREWIDDIVRQANTQKVPVFMKESLRGIMGADFRQDKLIWSVK